VRSAARIGNRALNRSLLARQLLLRRSAGSVEGTIGHLVGMQAQSPQTPYVGLWTRLDGFVPEELSRLLLERRVVRVAVMRGTVHLVTADDCLSLRPLVQPLYERNLGAKAWAPSLAGLDLAEIESAGRALVEERPRTAKELGAQLSELWPGRDPAALAHAIRGRLALVQVPPRGLWGASGQTTCTTAEAWLDRPLDPEPSVDDLVRRYLAAFGPATVADVQTWSGLTGLGEVVGRLRSSLLSLMDDQGREVFDLPDAPRPDPDTTAPVRFLPEFDNLLLSHSDRTRVISDEDRQRLKSANGVLPGLFLVDGWVRGSWKTSRRRGAATLTITPFRRLSKRSVAAVTAEGTRLLRFTAAGDAHDIQLVPR
jgi:hypothetical protein